MKFVFDTDVVVAAVRSPGGASAALVRDPVDDMVLEAAVNAMADAIVTFNGKDFADAPQRFGIDVLLPRDALARLRASSMGNNGVEHG